MTRPDMFAVDKETPIPLYYQLKRRIQDMIEVGVLQVGDLLPTESELCECLSVSRPTVRQALNDLVLEGYLTRKKGKGTFVSKPKIDIRFFQKLESFDHEMKQKGLTPSTKVISLRKIPAIEHVNNILDLEPDEPLILLVRLRFANNEPMVYLDTHIPCNQYPDMLFQDFAAHSFYDCMERFYNARIFRVVREIEAVNANRREAELLDIDVGKAVCLVKTVGYTEDGTPVEYSVARYRGDRNKFSVELYH